MHIRQFISIYYNGDVLGCEALRKHEEREIKWYKDNSVIHTYILPFVVHQKAHVGPKSSQTEKIKPIALAVLELRLSEVIS